MKWKICNEVQFFPLTAEIEKNVYIKNDDKKNINETK